MATAVVEANKNVDCFKSVKDLVESAATKTVPDKYVFPEDKRPSAAELSKGESIPIIDVSALDRTEQERLQTIEALGQACADWGFFRVVNHGIEESLIESMLEVALGFFSLSLEEKMKYGNKDVLDPVRFGTSFNIAADQFLNWRDYLKHFCHPELHTPENPTNYRDQFLVAAKE